MQEPFLDVVVETPTSHSPMNTDIARKAQWSSPRTTKTPLPEAQLIPFVSLSSLAVLALMGGLAAHAGGAKVIMGAVRVTFWGGLAMAMTAGIGWLVGAIA